MRISILLLSMLFSFYQLSGQPPIITAGTETVLEDETVSVPVSVQNFTNVVSIQFTLEWDPTVMTYQGTGDYGLPGLSEFNFGEPQVANGRLTFVWFDGQVAGLTLPDDAIIFSVSFLAIGELGESSAVSFISEPTPIQIGVIDGVIIEEVDGTFNVGEVLIISEVLQVETATTDNLCFGESQGTITPQVMGGVTPYTFSWTGPDAFTSTATTLSNLAAGNYALTITDQNGTTFNDTYLINEPPALEVVTLQIEESDCNSPTGSIALSMTGGTPEYSYDFGEGFGPDPQRDGLAAGTYPVQIRDAEGCLLDTTIVIAQANGPEVDLADDFVLCPDEEATLTAGSDATLTYTWTLDGQPLSATTNAINVDAAGVYTVSTMNAAGCTANDELVIEAGLTPELSLAEEAIFCPGDETVLTASSNTDLTYSWTLDGEAIAPITNEIMVTTPGLYAVTATNADGCNATDEIMVTEAESPAVDLGTPFALCPEEEATLTAGSDATLTYTWTLDGQPLAATTNAISIDAAGVYAVSTTNAAGCTATDELTVNAAAAPDLDLGDDVGICPGEALTLQASPDPTFTYSWTLAGQAIPPTTNVIEVTETGVYTVSASSDAGCTATDEIVVSTAILPPLELGADTSICPKTTIVLIANDDLVTFNWTLDGNTTGGDAPELAASDPGQYVITATTIDGCTVSDTLQLSTIPFDTEAGPADTTIFVGQPVTLFATGGIAYNWISNVELSCNDCPNPEVTLEVTTTFQVNITSEEGCERAVTFVVNVEEGPEVLVDLVNFISPNGDGKNDVLIFRGLENYRGNQLSIYNRWGDLLFSKPNYQLDGEYWDGTLRGQPLPPGIYFYVLNIDIASKPIKSSLTLVID